MKTMRVSFRDPFGWGSRSQGLDGVGEGDPTSPQNGSAPSVQGTARSSGGSPQIGGGSGSPAMRSPDLVSPHSSPDSVSRLQKKGIDSKRSLSSKGSTLTKGSADAGGTEAAVAVDWLDSPMSAGMMGRADDVADPNPHHRHDSHRGDPLRLDDPVQDDEVDEPENEQPAETIFDDDGEPTGKGWPRWRQTVRTWMFSPYADIFGMVVIATHVISLVVMVENQGGDVEGSAAIVSYCCTALMVVDFVGKATGSIIKDWKVWLMVDFLLLLTSGIVAPVLRYNYPDGVGRDLEWLQVLSAFRLLRVVQNNKVKVHRTWSTLAFTLSHLGYEMAAFVLLGSVLSLVLGVLSTVFIGHVLSDDEDEGVANVADYYFGTLPRSILTAIESFNSGIDWEREIVAPLRDGNQKVHAYLVLSLLLISACSVYNLVLGLFVKEVYQTSSEYDAKKDEKTFGDAEVAMKSWRQVMDELDAAKTGRITEENLKAYEEIEKRLKEDPKGLGTVPSFDGVKKIWEGLLATNSDATAEEPRSVPVSDMLFGILRSAGVATSQSMLNIPYQQKMLMRELGLQEKKFKKMMERLDGEKKDGQKSEGIMPKVDKLINELSGDVERLMKCVDHAIRRRQHDNEKQRGKMDGIIRKAKRTAVDLHDQYLHKGREIADTLQTRLEHLHRQSMDVAKDYWVAYLWEIALQDMPALRVAVRRRLDTELWPRLANELARNGSDFATFSSDSEVEEHDAAHLERVAP